MKDYVMAALLGMLSVLVSTALGYKLTDWGWWVILFLQIFSYQVGKIVGRLDK